MAMDIDWSKQHCGVHQANFLQLTTLMPDVADLINNTFPDDPTIFLWDVKVHMLMPNQYPCIPNWHFDNVPRVNNAQDFKKVKPNVPMYLYVSNEPLTEFKVNGKIKKVKAKTWHKFTQLDEHRGTISHNFCWRGFIRATHFEIMGPKGVSHDPYRRHSQVYLDAENFRW